ncbi:MAG: hypothetical protein ABIF18_00460 [archaeon]
MEEQPQKIQNYIWIIVSISMYILGLIVASCLIFTYFSTSDSGDSSEKVIADGEEQTQEIIQNINVLRECAVSSPNQRCTLFYSNPSIEARCNQLETLRDQCFYNFATINQRPDTCDKITNTTLENKCQEEIQMLFVSEE